MPQQFIIGGPLIDFFFPFDAGPREIHTDEFESGCGDQIEVALVAGDEMNIYADAGGNDWFGNFGGGAG